MGTTGKPQKRWMTSVLKTASREAPALPFQRGNRKSLAERSSARALRTHVA